MIEGSGLYKEKHIFIREFVQNAIDALKMQLWRDLKNDVHLEYRGKSKEELSQLMPFEIPSEIFDRYYVTVDIKTLEDKNQTQVTISDNGIGITIEQWLRPTGGFGIGMQSAFLVTE